MAQRLRRLSLFSAFAITLLTAAAPAIRAQYCTFGLGGFPNTASIDSVSIVGTTLANPSPGTAPTFFTYYTPPTGAVTATVQKGSTYTIFTRFGFGPARASLWIDFNRDTVFQASEWTEITANALTSATATFTVPLNAVTGLTRMRVRTTAPASVNGAGDACTNLFSGETEDYDITIDPAPACIGTPVVSSILPAGPILVCGPTVPVTLTVFAGNFSFSYLWQRSIDGGLTWTPLPDTTNVAIVFSSAPTSLYRAIVGCVGSGQSDTSNNVVVNVGDPTYAAIPFTETFESWISYCDSFDVPGNNWRNTPVDGDPSWRRDDQGATADWVLPTTGGYTPTAQSGLHSARWHSRGALQADTGNLDLLVNLSSATGPKQLYFYQINTSSFGEDSLLVRLSVDGGVNFNTIAAFDTAVNWRQRSVAINSASATAVIRFQGKLGGFFDGTDIGIDSVHVALPCAGAPEAGVLVPGPALVACAGGTQTFSLQGTSLAGNLTYAWQVSNSCTTPVWTTIAGATSPTYTTPVLNATRSYRAIVTCVGSGLTDTAGPTCIAVTPPTYATLPYFQDFENWNTRCQPSDIPDNNWTNTPPRGDSSWRRNNQGATANWTTPAGGQYGPASFTGAYSARFHSTSVPFGGFGNLDLYVNAGSPGGKELQFHYLNNPAAFFSDDSLKVFLSTDNGVSFAQIGAYDTTADGVWTLQSIPFTSTSAQTILRLQGHGGFGGTDLGVDNLKVLLPCNGAPTAGTIPLLTPCPGVPFTLQLIGASQAAGLTYLWEQSANGTVWTPVPGGNVQTLTYSITTPTYFRATVTCTASGVSSTTPVVFYQIPGFYACYCASGVTPSSPTDGEDIGNVTVREVPSGVVLSTNGAALPLENNPTATRLYTNYTTLTPDTFYKTAEYSIGVSQISLDTSFAVVSVAGYLDFDRNGVYNSITERVFLRTITDSTTQRGLDSFVVPATAGLGLTGLRIVMTPGYGVPQPCGLDAGGETEDYVVFLAPQRCSGNPDAGTAFWNDTAICLGDVVTLIDTGYADTSLLGITYLWQRSTTPFGPWTTVTGSIGQDTIQVAGITDTTYFRFRVNCSYSGLTTSSNVLRIRVKQPIQCYCRSFATGVAQDASDANALGIGPFVVNEGGPHLLNPTAIRHYTDRTQNLVAYLEVDSTYDLTVYHAMRTGTHADAKVTLFMDFNRNYQYDIPGERVFTGYNSATQPFVNGTISIPLSAVPNLRTGMRLIVNEDTAPNLPSDDGCGTYFSGETEDYAIIFLPKGGFAAGIPRVDEGLSAADVQLFPNPASERVRLRIRAGSALGEVAVTVRSVTGAVVREARFDGVGAEMSEEVELSGAAPGVYVVEVRSGGERVVRRLVVR